MGTSFCLHYESYQVVCFLCIYKANIMGDIITIRVKSNIVARPRYLQWSALCKKPSYRAVQTKSVVKDFGVLNLITDQDIHL